MSFSIVQYCKMCCLVCYEKVPQVLGGVSFRAHYPSERSDILQACSKDLLKPLLEPLPKKD